MKYKFSVVLLASLDPISSPAISRLQFVWPQYSGVVDIRFGSNRDYRQIPHHDQLLLTNEVCLQTIPCSASAFQLPKDDHLLPLSHGNENEPESLQGQSVRENGGGSNYLLDDGHPPEVRRRLSQRVHRGGDVETVDEPGEHGLADDLALRQYLRHLHFAPTPSDSSIPLNLRQPASLIHSSLPCQAFAVKRFSVCRVSLDEGVP